MSTARLKVGFVALGLIGGSIAKNIRRVFPDAYITALNRSTGTLDLAIKEGIIDHGTQKLDESFPGLKEKYIRYFGNRYECASPNAKKLWQVFTEECEKYGILYDMKAIIYAYKAGYDDGQLSFFD